jgi:hypothetical protein
LPEPPSGDTINFGCGGDVVLTSTLTIGKDLTLDGSNQGVVLDGGGNLQVLSVNSGVSLTLNALTVADGFGFASGSGLDNEGGAVTITNSTFMLDSANCGGGLYNHGGTVTIRSSTFARNSSAISGGAVENDEGTMSIANSNLAGNTQSGSPPQPRPRVGQRRGRRPCMPLHDPLRP